MTGRPAQREILVGLFEEVLDRYLEATRELQQLREHNCLLKPNKRKDTAPYEVRVNEKRSTLVEAYREALGS